MKKLGLFFAAAVAAIVMSCGPSTPKADFKNEIDTLSYAIGMAQTQGLKEYMTQRLNVDTAYLGEFVKGLNEAANAGDDAKKAAYYAGIQIGQQVSQQMMKGINYELFGDDSTQTISLKNFMAGFISGTTGKNGLMTVDSASNLAQTMMKTVKAKPKKKLDACDYAGIWSDEEYMDADEMVKGMHSARHFKDRTKFWDEL